MEFDYLEEFPTLMLPWLQQASGHNTTEVLVMVMEYGKNFSGNHCGCYKIINQ